MSDNPKTEEAPQRRDYAKRTLRERAFHVIDGEREYQQTKYPGNKTLAEHIKLVQQYAAELSQTSRTNNPVMDTLDAMRKIAALAVRAMEEHGAIYRAEPLR